jgi:hypothetical protein
MKECLGATAALITGFCAGGVQILHDIIICEETAPEHLLYVSTAPKIVQTYAFLHARYWLLKCLNLESADFQMSPSDIG